MRESMTLIEQANIFNKTNHQSLFFDRIYSKTKLDSRYFPSNTIKQTKSYRTEKFILPSIDKDNNRSRKTIKRPSYRTSLYHSNSTNTSRIDLSSITARGTKPELITTIKDDDTIINFQRHHAPPPSPSDDQIERLLAELNHSRPCTPIETDGYVPYRLPALHQSARGRYKEPNIPPKEIKSTLSNYLQTFY